MQITNRYYLGPNFAHKRYERYAAPSWSWAPLDGPVLMERVTSHMSSRFLNFNKPERVATVVDVHVSLLGADPFGHVRCGGLYLQARSVPPLMAKTNIQSALFDLFRTRDDL